MFGNNLNVNSNVLQNNRQSRKTTRVQSTTAGLTGQTHSKNSRNVSNTGTNQGVKNIRLSSKDQQRQKFHSKI